MSAAERVAIALPAGRSLGGVTTWALELAERLATNHSTRLLEHPSGRSDLVVADELHNRAEVTSLVDLPPPNHVLVSNRDVAAYAERYAAPDPQILIPNWSWGAYAASCAAIAADAGASRIVSFVHADGPDYYDWATYYESAITLFVAVSEQIRSELAARIPHRAHDVVVLPYPVDVDPTTRTAHDGPLRIAYAGRISIVQKRIIDIVEVCRRLAASHVAAEVRIVGGGPDEAALEAALATLDRGGTVRVTFEPPVPADAMREVWRWADVCLLTSDYEGTSIAMLEAMASGAVPVVTAVSGTAALIDEGRTGHTSSIGDLDQMAEHLASLAQDRVRLAEMSRAAQHKIAQRGGTSEYDSRLVELLDAAAAAPPRTLSKDIPLLPGHRHATIADVPSALRGDHHAAKRIAYRLGASALTRPLLRLRPLLERRRTI